MAALTGFHLTVGAFATWFVVKKGNSEKLCNIFVCLFKSFIELLSFCLLSRFTWAVVPLLKGGKAELLLLLLAP